MGTEFDVVPHLSIVCKIERFHSRDYRPCWFTGTKESICIKIEFNTQRFSLGHQHGHHFFVLGHQHRLDFRRSLESGLCSSFPEQRLEIKPNTNMAAMTSCENTL